MAASVIHVLQKNDYATHHLLTLPSDPLPDLAPSSLRLQSKILGLTTNNLTYARLGHLLGWWDIHPLPSNTPAPFNDSKQYGRISAWGYAEIIASTVPGIPIGKSVLGYLPIGTLPVDVEVKDAGYKNQLLVLNPHRQHLWIIYNRLELCPPIPEMEAEYGRDFLGWDALMWGLFATSYNLSTYGFAWEDANRIHPSGIGDWSADDANLDDATVVCLSGSGKTAMAFAYSLRQCRPQAHQPKFVIAVCSGASKQMAEDSKFYDKAVLYSDDVATKDLLVKSGTSRVILIDFGARAGATATWESTLSTLPPSIPFSKIFVGTEVKVQKPEEASKRMAQLGEHIVVNASLLREKGIESGGDAYLEKWGKDIGEFKRKGGISSMKLNDEVPASVGLVYRI
ncbi:uncharacterized protein BDR25DRAFT_393939 [Lindgomyces ingoldianus]|uniref:Uncharacterized protein n=1 Tax=Lindgomyces ingoldianus TaxID=673940 RepID=A0ACB6QTW1_9PLEO|nr:uncharacterized protein BDR25DRAFT_393939 [Lindgomyces ingoldianus]KAF2470464.1 hypothetical protein BDR25DRAFT_393939 [Lindgomyces ingoldianus]